MANLLANLQEVDRLVQIHKQVAGSTVGKKHNVEVLNKSGIVLLVACWEAFVEDLAEASFNLLLRKADSPQALPQKVLTVLSKKLREEKDDRRLWDLAGEGWRTVLRGHKETVVAKFVGNFNTPKPGQIDDLFAALLGLHTISKKWSWHRCPPAKARLRLAKLVALRGDIAHRVSAPTSVQKRQLVQAAHFVQRLAVATHNAANASLRERLGYAPWDNYEAG